MKRVGIALGGGGAKGLAHIPMLEVLDELGVVPDCVAGTSIGAIVGGLYCAGHAGRAIRELVERELFGKRTEGGGSVSKLSLLMDLVDPRFGRGGLVKGERFVDVLCERIGADRFEDLSIPLVVVAADFWRREEVVLDRGPLRPAIKASMSLPALFEPVVLEDRVLMDGGLVNPVPYDRLGDCELRIAVDVAGTRSHARGAMPTLSEAIFNSFQIMNKSIVREKMMVDPPEIYVCPELEDVRVLDFDKAEAILAQAEPARDALRAELLARLGI